VALWAFGLVGGIGALIKILAVSALFMVVCRLYIGKNVLTDK
jgi:hypothetical protein